MFKVITVLAYIACRKSMKITTKGLFEMAATSIMVIKR